LLGSDISEDFSDDTSTPSLTHGRALIVRRLALLPFFLLLSGSVSSTLPSDKGFMWMSFFFWGLPLLVAAFRYPSTGLWTSDSGLYSAVVSRSDAAVYYVVIVRIVFSIFFFFFSRRFVCFFLFPPRHLRFFSVRNEASAFCFPLRSLFFFLRFMFSAEGFSRPPPSIPPLELRDGTVHGIVVFSGAAAIKRLIEHWED